MNAQEQQIRRSFPKQTEGRALMRDERIVAHASQVKGIDAWYVLTNSGARQYFIKRDSWPPYLGYDPEEWHQENVPRSKAAPVRSILYALFEHGLRLDEYRREGGEVKRRLDALRSRGGNTKNAADALLDLVRNELFHTYDHPMPGSLEKELDEAGVCQYAWYLSWVLGFDVDAFNSADKGARNDFGPLPRFQSYGGFRLLSCTILASLDPTSPQRVVMEQSELNYSKERLRLPKAIQCIKDLSLDFGLYVKVDGGLDAFAPMRGGDTYQETLYDLVHERKADVFSDETAPGGIRVVARGEHPGKAGAGVWHEDASRPVYVRFVCTDEPSFNLAKFFLGLEKRSPKVAVLGGYTYTPSDYHNFTPSEHEYDLVGDTPRSYFGLEGISPVNEDWNIISFNRLTEIEPWHSYDKVYVRIRNAYFEAGIHAATKNEEGHRLGEPVYLALTKGTREDAERAIALFEKLLS